MPLKITKDQITPDLRKKLAGIRDRRPVLEAMGIELVSLTKRAFNDAALRAAPWPPKKDGSPATLKRKGTLWQSIRITSVTPDAVTVGSDRPYAAVHQLGSSKSKGRGSGIPARPFFPVLGGVLARGAMDRVVAVAQAKIKSLLQ